MSEDPQLTIEQQRRQISELQGQVDQLESARRQLLAAEQANARIPELELAILDLQQTVAAEHAEAKRARNEAHNLEMRLFELHETMAGVFSSPSWRLTAPLRDVKQILRRT